MSIWLAIFLWWLSGFVPLVFFIKSHDGQFLVEDALTSTLFSVMGPIAAIWGLIIHLDVKGVNVMKIKLF